MPPFSQIKPLEQSVKNRNSCLSDRSSLQSTVFEKNPFEEFTNKVFEASLDSHDAFDQIQRMRVIPPKIFEPAPDPDPVS